MNEKTPDSPIFTLTTDSTRNVSCSHCQVALPSNHTGPCPQCGKTGRTVEVRLVEEIEAADSMSASKDVISPEILLQAEIIVPAQAVSDGILVSAAAIPWLAIYREIKRDPEFLLFFSKNPRKFEEFIAGAYDQAGWDEVILTPRSGDGGRDVIATTRGFGSIRFLEQTKAYSPNHLVTHNDVRAMLGVLSTDPNSSKGLITTTSDFEPTIKTSPEFSRFMPHRLELKSGGDLQVWLDEVAKQIKSF